MSGRIPLKFQRSENAPGVWTKFEIVWFLIIMMVCVACLCVSYFVPRPKFDVALQNGSLIVKRASEEDMLHVGDVIEAVNGHPVETRAELFFQFARADGIAELTVRRLNSRFIRPLNQEAFAANTIPAGLGSEDRPIAISFGEAYSPLENFDIEQLRSLIQEHPEETVSVIFRRPAEQMTVSVQLPRSVGRTLALSVILVMCAVMGFVWFVEEKRGRTMRAVRMNLALGLGTLGVLWLASAAILLSIPFLFLIGMMSLALYKAFDMDFHLHDVPPTKVPDKWLRVSLYLLPLVLMLAPVAICIMEFPMMWGGSGHAVNEMRLDMFSMMPFLIVVAYTFWDAGMSVMRQYRQKIRVPRDIALYLASVLGLAAFFVLWSDPAVARAILIAAIVVQFAGNVLECFMPAQKKNPLLWDHELFSAVPIREALMEAEEILNHRWVVQAVIDRPEPCHVVGIVADDEASPFAEVANGLSLQVLSRTWRDFLELYRTEGMGEDSDSLVAGIANRLGIVLALPVSEKVAGSLTNIMLLVSTHEIPEGPDQGVPEGLTVSQKAALREVADRLALCDMALVYLSSEMSLHFVGDDLSEIANRVHETASFPRVLRNPTLPLTASEIPHGLLDEDDPNEDGVKPVEDLGSHDNRDEVITKVFHDEMSLLRSQLHSLCSQQIRAYALSEVEFTLSQKAAFEDLISLDTPIMIIGEQRTGKTLLALAAHRSRSSGPFLQIDAADIPETILVLEMFGDSENIGLLRSALGGSLLIKNVDRLSTAVLGDIMEAMDNLASEGTVELYLTMTLRQEEVSGLNYRNDPRSIPLRCRELADHCDAEIVCLEPLREQVDLLKVAEAMMHREAVHNEKQVTAFSAQVRTAIGAYRWPGNFGELRAVMERAVMRSSATEMSLEELGPDFEALINDDTRNAALNENELIHEQLQHLQEQADVHLAQIDRLKARIHELEQGGASDASDELFEGRYDDIEKRVLTRLLEKYQNNPEIAVEGLSTNRTKFFNKLRKYGLL